MKHIIEIKRQVVEKVEKIELDFPLYRATESLDNDEWGNPCLKTFYKFIDPTHYIQVMQYKDKNEVQGYNIRYTFDQWNSSYPMKVLENKCLGYSSNQDDFGEAFNAALEFFGM